MTAYFDSCYIAKLYLSEPDSPAVRARAEASTQIVCSVVGQGEVVSTLRRHVREGRLTAPAFKTLLEQLRSDLRADVWRPLPVTQGVIDLQIRVLASIPPKLVLRATDALHLATAARAGLTEVFSSDARLLEAAPFFRLSPVRL